MLKRIITSIVALCVLFPIVFFSDKKYYVFPIALGIVSVICIYELFKCMGMGKRLYLSLPLYLFAALCPSIIAYEPFGAKIAYVAFIFATLYIIYLFTIIVWSHGKLVFSEALTLFAMCTYIIAALNCIVYVRYYGNIGKYIYLLVFIGAWVTDTFAYFTGYFLGKHKLIEDVSPKKTVEGSIGGIVFCTAAFLIFGFVIERITDLDANYIFLGISGILISVISQTGDLIMSVIKRHYKIKDYGIIFPGHGGMLDRFDSILAVSLGLGAICMFMSLTNITLF